MKKLHLLALSMLLSTPGMMMQAREHLHDSDDFDQVHGLNKKRNDNTYDGSQDCCDGNYKFVDDGYDTYDEIHHLNKKRNSDAHPVCSKSCGKQADGQATCSKTCMSCQEHKEDLEKSLTLHERRLARRQQRHERHEESESDSDSSESEEVKIQRHRS